MGQHKVAKAIKEKHVIKFQKFDSPKSQKLTLIINGLRSLPRPYGMVLIIYESRNNLKSKFYTFEGNKISYGKISAEADRHLKKRWYQKQEPATSSVFIDLGNKITDWIEKKGA